VNPPAFSLNGKETMSTEVATPDADLLPVIETETDSPISTLPYRVDADTYKFDTIEKNPQTNEKFILSHRFRRFDSSPANISLYEKREKEVVNEVEEIGKDDRNERSITRWLMRIFITRWSSPELLRHLVD
jgi:hypothetical protein